MLQRLVYFSCFWSVVLTVQGATTGPYLEEFRKPKIIYPESNPYTKEKETLGKALFFDPLLSGTGTMACASCHSPSMSWGNGRAKAIGNGGRELTRKVPTLFNVALGWSYFWDGRAQSLEEQALMPIQSHVEMNLDLAELVRRLNLNEGYRALFARAFPGEAISPSSVARAIATYERTLISGPSPFDRWASGDRIGISESAQRGFALFNQKAGCVTCHSGWNFSNGSFADVGTDGNDIGRGAVKGNESFRHFFKTPTLRNIAKRAPYMHDGSIKSLESVIDHYDRGGSIRRDSTQLFLKPLQLSPSEKNDLLAFLLTLTSEEEL